jgi:hypothetical protein
MKTRSFPRRSLLLVLALSAAASILPARIISYAPVTNRYATPALQNRLNRYYLLIESDSPASGNYRAQVVIYDSRGEREPQVIFPSEGTEASIRVAAVREGSDGVAQILLASDADVGGDNPYRYPRFFFSSDSGQTWTVVPFPVGTIPAATFFHRDVGGRFVGERGSPIRIGSAEYPFVVRTSEIGSRTPNRIYAVRQDGSPRVLMEVNSEDEPRLIGSNREGTLFLIGGLPFQSATTPRGVGILDMNGLFQEILSPAGTSPDREGWITPDGSVYLEETGRSLSLYRNGSVTQVSSALPGTAPPPGDTGLTFPLNYFAVPTADFGAAWIIQRGAGMPTILSRHTPGADVVEQWRDVSGPEVEAIHAGASGRKLLIHVRVPRPQGDQQILHDPALAIWEFGQPAPARYDELFLNEGIVNAFVNLDVERVSDGEPFVFDSAATVRGAPSPLPGITEVPQEWGVVRASLKQKLVVPAVGRLPGAFESFWRTDLIVRNPSTERISVTARFVPSSTGGSSVTQPVERRIELGPSEIWLYADVLGSIFEVERGSGALFLVPDGDVAITATSRTYTESGRGTYGMGIGAVDLFAAAGSRFPVSFSGALQGLDFRTNVVAVETSGRGSELALRANVGTDGGTREFSFQTPAAGQTQVNGLGALLDVPADRPGALVLQPFSGEVVASAIAVDNQTNDPTYFPPDLHAPYVRTIPAIGHVDGANGSRFRSDLYLFNASDQMKSITLSSKRWDLPEDERTVNLSLRPRESRTIRDVLLTTFEMTGIARLRYSSAFGFDSNGIRVTSRLYTIDSAGGTYGLLIPPLDSFQVARPGESLEILGPQGGRNFRTNLSLVELTAIAGRAPVGVRIDILDDFGTLLDSFETSVPVAGGVQLLDIFRARGLEHGPAAALIRVSPLAGLVGAFATTLDNGTNDPTYYGASLASR